MIESAIRENVKLIVGAYRRATKMSVNAVSKRFYGHHTRLAEFLKGESSMSVHTLDAMLETIAAEWPENAEWPLCRAIIIPRPAKKKLLTHSKKESSA